MERIGPRLDFSHAHFVEHLEGIFNETQFTESTDEGLKCAPSGHPFGERSEAFEEIIEQRKGGLGVGNEVEGVFAVDASVIDALDKKVVDTAEVLRSAGFVHKFVIVSGGWCGGLVWGVLLLRWCESGCVEEREWEGDGGGGVPLFDDSGKCLHFD